MRQEGHLAEIQTIEHVVYDGIMSSAKAIVAKDRLDVQRADLVVAGFLGAKIASIGTTIELGWADAWDKTTILIMEPQGNPNDRFFLTELADFRVATVREAAEVAKAILLPGI
jgi:nucleoside 2-deoxyribosyltransferase